MVNIYFSSLFLLSTHTRTRVYILRQFVRLFRSRCSPFSCAASPSCPPPPRPTWPSHSLLRTWPRPRPWSPPPLRPWSPPPQHRWSPRTVRSTWLGTTTVLPSRQPPSRPRPLSATRKCTRQPQRHT